MVKKIRFDHLMYKKYILQYLPNDFLELSKQPYFYHENKKLKSAFLIDLVHSLVSKYFNKKNNKLSLSSEILKERYGYLYNYYIKYLITNKVLKLILNYKKGINCRIYELNINICKGNILRYRNTDKIILKRYNLKSNINNFINKSNETIIPIDIKKKLVIDLYSIKVDYAKSIFYLDNTLNNDTIYNRNKYSIDCIDDNQIFYHFDEYGRMHTNFTVLKSFIRKNCLLIDEEETYEVDISNSQPIFLNILMQNVSYYHNEGVQFYRYLTYNGKFYQYIMDKFPLYTDKKMVKEMVYKVFFGKNKKNIHDINFEYLFPEVYGFILNFKKNKGDYRSLSHALQLAESNLIFNKIVKSIMNYNPDIKLVTIHDSIICAKKYSKIVKLIFEEKLKQHFNMN
jgi:hypothetical protein